MDDVSVDGGRVVTEDARSVYVASDARCKLGVLRFIGIFIIHVIYTLLLLLLLLTMTVTMTLISLHTFILFLC